MYARTASGNTAPLRTLSGPATGIDFLRGLAVDTVNNELLVVSQANSVTVYPRTASGSTAPLRTLQGPATGLSNPQALVLVASGSGPPPPPPPTTVPVTVTRLGSGTGTVTSDPAGISCPPTCTFSFPSGTFIALTATPTGGSTFSGWGGDCAAVGTAPTCVGTLTGAATVTATFNGPSSSASGFVTRLYLLVLARAPEQGGVDSWVQKIQQDGSVVPTVLAFFHSPEFLSRNTSNKQFLTICYRTFLNRDPDLTGFNAFLTALQAGQLTRDNLLDLFIDSQEFAILASFLPPLSKLDAFVTTLYVRILGRGPDLPGRQSFVTPLQQSCTAPTILGMIRIFLASPEFQARQTTNTEFVTILYRLFLNRVPDAQGLASFVALLNQGTASRDQLVIQFDASAEFQATLQRLCS